MNITEFMSFDLAWFTTLPGILITGGVVVLLIALIIFIASNKKEKNSVPEATPIADNMSQSVSDNTADMVMTSSDAVATPNMSVDNNFAVNNGINEMNMMNNNNPIDNNISSNDIPNGANMDVPSVPSYSASATPTNVVNFSVPTAPVDTNATFTSFDSAPMAGQDMPGSSAQVESPVVPEVTPVVAPVTPAVPEVTPVAAPIALEVQEKPVIYGGVDPVNTVATDIPEKPVIYGGANPLENTTTLPVMGNHEAYGATNSSPIVEPVIPVSNEPVTADIAQSNSSTPVEPVVVPSIEPTATPVVDIPVAAPTMPVTGAEMFASDDANVASSPVNAGNEIETLDF